MQELKLWEEKIDFKCEKGSFTNGIYGVHELIKLQKKQDKMNHFGKAIIGDELVLIFVKAKRFDSKVFRFNLCFNPHSLEKDEYLNWEYLGGGGGCSGFFLSAKDNPDKRNFDLNFHWSRLDNDLKTLFGLMKKDTATTPGAALRNILALTFTALKKVQEEQ